MRILALFFCLLLASCASVDVPSDNAPDANITPTDSSAKIPTVTLSQDGALTPADYEAAMTPFASDEVREAFIKRLPRVTIDDDGTPRTRILWEGDQLLTKDEVEFLVYSSDFGPEVEIGEMRVMTDEQGNVDYWVPGKRQLTYWVHPATFRSKREYDATRTALAIAARDWEAVCSECQLTIREVATPELATFKVQFLPGDQSFLAAAFYPSDPVWRRFLYIGPEFFTTGFEKAGIMRHELGHVLGYRHEHIVGVTGCYREDNRWVPLTTYDPQSVMHYFCGGGGTRDLKLSEYDKLGHVLLYRHGLRLPKQRR